MNQIRLTNPSQREKIALLPETNQREKSTYFNRELLNSLNVINSQPAESQKHTKSREKRGKFRPFFERLREKHETKNSLCDLLSELGQTELEHKFRDCSSRFQVLTDGNHIADRKVTFHCSHRACPFCAAIRSRRLINDYLPKVEAYHRANASVTACHLVITQKHYENEPLSDCIKRLLSNFRKLIRRDFWKEHLDSGGCYAVEFTVGRDGLWHAHLHCFVFRRRFFKVKQFRAVWRDVTGDSENFKIRKIDTISGGLEEVIGYISKPIDVAKFKAGHLKQVLDLKSTRLFSTFGKFRAFAAAFEAAASETSSLKENKVAGDLCEICGGVLFLVHHDISAQIEFEKRVAGVRRIHKTTRRE